MLGDYLSITEMAESWGIHPRTVQLMCREGKIEGAVKFGKSWAIPQGVERPKDMRVKSGKYKNWRKKTKEIIEEG